MPQRSSRSTRGEQQSPQQAEQCKITDLFSLYNSPTLSDVTIILPPKRGKKRKKNDGGPALEDTAERIFAHKVILGSASSVLESHFKKVRPTLLDI